MKHFSERYLLPVANFKMANSVQILISSIMCDEKHCLPCTLLKNNAKQKYYHLISFNFRYLCYPPPCIAVTKAKLHVSYFAIFYLTVIIKRTYSEVKQLSVQCFLKISL